MENTLQGRIYKFIVEYINANGIPPTKREIAQAMRLSSTGHIDHHLNRLEEKGLIIRVRGSARGIKLPHLRGIPVKGKIAAGSPLENDVDPDQMVDINGELAQLNTYALEVAGTSMIDDHICHGDYVVIRPQLSCQNGDIVVAVHLLEENKSSATLKRFFQEHGRVCLQPANSTMGPIYISMQEWEREWAVQGKVIAIFRQDRATM
jgi:repressor LexA